MAVNVTVGSDSAGPPVADSPGVTSNVALPPRGAEVGPFTPTVKTGEAMTLIAEDADAVTAPSAVSLNVTAVAREPGAVPGATATVAEMAPSDVPVEIGVASVDVHVRVSFVLTEVLVTHA